MHDSIYLPREDSHLLQKTVKKYTKGKTLELGTGSFPIENVQKEINELLQ